MYSIRSLWKLLRVIFLSLPVILGLTGCIKDETYCCCSTGQGTLHYPAERDWFGDGYSCKRKSACTGEPYNCGKTSSLTPNTSVMLASNLTILPSSLSSTISTQYSRNCNQECDDNNQSPYCLVIRRGDAANLADQLDQLSEVFKSSSGAIQKEQIMKIFDVKDDPCNRSATSLSDGIVANSGDACDFKIALNIGPVSQKLFIITIPKELRGSIDISNDVTAKFEKKENAAMLEIDDLLNNDFGGYIHSISKQGNRLTIGTENGCIAFR